MAELCAARGGSGGGLGAGFGSAGGGAASGSTAYAGSRQGGASAASGAAAGSASARRKLLIAHAVRFCPALGIFQLRYPQLRRAASSSHPSLAYQSRSCSPLF